MSNTKITVDDKQTAAVMNDVVDDLRSYYKIKATVTVGSPSSSGTHVRLL